MHYDNNHNNNYDNDNNNYDNDNNDGDDDDYHPPLFIFVLFSSLFYFILFYLVS